MADDIVDSKHSLEILQAQATINNLPNSPDSDAEHNGNEMYIAAGSKRKHKVRLV